jgi:NAD(P)-dependent dehydrogenase (short-subunit alcohol dehydrogenase family)
LPSRENRENCLRGILYNRFGGKALRNIVITGSTRGIGLGLAEAFLQLGCNVILSGRQTESVHQSIEIIRQKNHTGKVQGIACDVRIFDQVQALWDFAERGLGQIDIWINNAGISNPRMPIWESQPEDVQSTLNTNMIGTVFGSMVAVKRMLEAGKGAVYNMEGMGSDGRKHPGLTFYGMSKYGLHYFNQSLIQETKNKPVMVGILRPGMVATDLITGQFDHDSEEWTRFQKIFNLLGERVEVVSPWLAKQVLENQQHGKIISYTNPVKLMSRFLSAPFTKRDILTKNEHP